MASCRISTEVTLFLFATVIILYGVLISPTSALASHYETYTYYETRSTPVCYTYDYTYCYNWFYWRYWYWGWDWSPYYRYRYWNPWYGWGYWPYCYSVPSQSCYYTYTSVPVTGTRCQAKWTGTNCDIPTCSPACTGGLICSDVDKCTCAGSGGTNCQIVPCSVTNNCYPGTCASNICQCPAGFSGDNCNQITQKPSITGCSVKLYANVGSTESVIATADCAAEGLTPLTAWIGNGLDTTKSNYGITKLEVDWEATYVFPLAMPGRPTGATFFFISNTPVNIGIADARYIVLDSMGTQRAQFPCRGVSTTSVLTSIKCAVSTPWKDLSINSILGHNATFALNMSASLGGQKEGDSTYVLGGVSYGFTPQPFVGVSAVQQAKFQFDTRPPSHCLFRSTNCSVFPISIDQDIRTDPVINPKFLEWTDDGSGIYKYHVEVFFLNEGSDGTLSEVGGPLRSGDITGTTNNFQFTAPKPGVYSIIVTVFDRANNSARARKIFNFNDQPSFKTVDSAPVKIVDSVTGETSTIPSLADYHFLTRTDNRDRLTLTWAGRFQSDPKYAAVFTKPVRPLDSSPTTVDDQYGMSYGMRSTAAVTNLTGISTVTWAFVVDRTTGGFAALEPTGDNSWTSIEDTKQESTELVLGESLVDGNTIVVFLKAVDVAGNPSSSVVRTFVDGSPVNVTKDEFIKRGVDTYTSKIVITAEDKHSGINATWYQITDVRSGAIIVPGRYVQPAMRDFPYLRKRATSGVQPPCTADDPTCYCTPLRQCYAVQQEIQIDHCLIDRYSNPDLNKLQVTYRMSNLAGVVTSDKIFDLGDISDLKCRPNGLSGGAIAGIVIGCILGLIIIILLFVVLIVFRRRPQIRERWTRRFTQARRRFTMKGGLQEADNVVYASQAQPPPYSEAPGPSKHRAKPPRGDIEGQENYGYAGDLISSSTIPRDSVQVKAVIDEGRFATISRAELKRDGKTTVVAVKALKNGFSQADELLMAKKIAFMKNLAPHGNIVAFIATVDEDNSPEGPFMLLEFCEESLKNWLGNIRSVSTDELEMMLGFALNIARGVEHLHKHRVIHRRLAVRNVLLQRQANGLVAKLIGFGPTAEDAGTDSGAAVVPMKWLAPETLDTLDQRKPTYNEKTDAWSFGITIWEMYSMGKAPYEDVRSADIKTQLKHGLRLTCPADCHPDLFAKAVSPCWEERPNKRPKFNAIVKAIDDFRRGTEQQQLAGGYYATNGQEEESEYTEAH